MLAAAAGSLHVLPIFIDAPTLSWFTVNLQETAGVMSFCDCHAGFSSWQLSTSSSLPPLLLALPSDSSYSVFYARGLVGQRRGSRNPGH